MWEPAQHKVEMVLVACVALWFCVSMKSSIALARVCESGSVWRTEGIEARRQSETLSPDVGVAVEKTISSGETHSYRIGLKAGQFLRLMVDQMGAEVTVTLFAPDGREITTITSLSGRLGPISVSVIAETAGEYRADLRIDRSAPPGKYRIRVELLRAAQGRPGPHLGRAGQRRGKSLLFGAHCGRLPQGNRRI